jgi:hypothetical protein
MLPVPSIRIGKIWQMSANQKFLDMQTWVPIVFQLCLLHKNSVKCLYLEGEFAWSLGTITKLRNSTGTNYIVVNLLTVFSITGHQFQFLVSVPPTTDLNWILLNSLCSVLALIRFSLIFDSGYALIITVPVRYSFLKCLPAGNIYCHIYYHVNLAQKSSQSWLFSWSCPRCRIHCWNKKKKNLEETTFWSI